MYIDCISGTVTIKNIVPLLVNNSFYSYKNCLKKCSFIFQDLPIRSVQGSEEKCVFGEFKYKLHRWDQGSAFVTLNFINNTQVICFT